MLNTRSYPICPQIRVRSVLYPVMICCASAWLAQGQARTVLSQDTQRHRSHRKENTVFLEETLIARSRTFEMLRARGVIPAQSRSNKVGVGFGGVRRGEDLNVGIGRVRRAAVDEVAVVQHKVYVRY